MNTYATIIVLVILTIVIFAFIGFALYSIFKSEKVIVSRKERDQYIIDEQNKNQSKKTVKYGKNGKVSSLVFTIIGYVIVIGILVFEGFAVITNSKNQLFYIGSKARLVVASDSMSSIYDDLDSKNQKVENGGNLTSDMIAEEFQIGDILTFTHAPSELDMINYTDTGSLEYTTNGSRYGNTISSDYLNKVFAFQYQNMIVIHRLVKIEQRTSDTTGENFFVYVFSGDKYPTQTQVVTYDSIQGIYTGSKVQGIGYAILFLGSVYGAYSIIGALIIIVATSFFTKRLTKLYASRYEEIIKERFDEEFSTVSFNKDEQDTEHEKIIEAEEFKVLPAKDHSKEPDEDDDEISSIKKR
jgi:hypothetical protein